MKDDVLILTECKPVIEARIALLQRIAANYKRTPKAVQVELNAARADILRLECGVA